MENNNVFTYRYSADRSREVARIRDKYLPAEEKKIDVLRRLDRRVQRAGSIEGLSIGVIGCLLFGIGLCFGLDVLAGATWLPLFFCLLGTAVMLPAYPVYRLISRRTWAALTPEILRLSEEILRS